MKVTLVYLSITLFFSAFVYIALLPNQEENAIGHFHNQKEIEDFEATIDWKRDTIRQGDWRWSYGVPGKEVRFGDGSPGHNYATYYMPDSSRLTEKKDTIAFHVRVDCFCTEKDCGTASWCIRFTRNNWKVVEDINESFYTYEATIQVKLFQNREDAIVLAKQIKSYVQAEKINLWAVDEYHRLKKEEQDKVKREKQSIQIR